MNFSIKKLGLRVGVVGFYLMGTLLPISKMNTIEHVPPFQQNAIPLYISIPNIDLVSAPVERVGLVDGAMGVPTHSDSVGWYSLGTTPGQEGSAVLAGHVNWFGGKDAVFTRLTEMQTGDIIQILDSFGDSIYFKVLETKEFPANADTREVFFSDSGRSYLNLITCSGEWNQSTKTHESRFVVFSERLYP